MLRCRHTALLIVLLLLITASIPVSGAAVSNTDVSSHTTNTSDISITSSSENLSTQSDTTEVVVQLTGHSRTAVTTSDRPVETMRATAARTRAPFLDYANSTGGIDILETFWITNAVLIEVDTDRVDFDRIEAVDGVDRIHENYEITTQSVTPSTTDDHISTRQNNISATGEAYTYGLQQINAPTVWSRYDTKGEMATVAVLDSGVDVSAHPDLELAEDGWKDFVYGRSTPYDDDTGHGTHVSGTIVGEQITDGSYAGAQYGVAPEAELLHGRVSDAGAASFSALLQGMEWAVEHDADVDVVSISLGAEEDGSDFIEPIQNANAAGIVVVVSAGNSGEGTATTPGNVYDAFSVGASDEDESIGSFSGGETVSTAETWGTAAPTEWPDEYIVPDVAAPGVGVYSAVPGGDYGSKSGTSMAAPHVAGTVALIQSATNESLTPSEIQTVLRRTAWKPEGESSDPDTRYGYGIVNASEAVGMATTTDFQINDLRAPTTVPQKTSYEITATITNRGLDTGTQSVTYELRNDSDVAVLNKTTEMTLAGNATNSTTVSIAGDEIASLSGNYTHVISTANDTTTQPVEITTERTVDFYTTSDGRVTARGLGDAARDFRDGLITPTVLGDVAAAFRSS